jgi:hypothetical protein
VEVEVARLGSEEVEVDRKSGSLRTLSVTETLLLHINLIPDDKFAEFRKRLNHPPGDYVSRIWRKLWALSGLLGQRFFVTVAGWFLLFFKTRPQTDSLASSETTRIYLVFWRKPRLLRAYIESEMNYVIASKLRDTAPIVEDIWSCAVDVEEIKPPVPGNEFHVTVKVRTKRWFWKKRAHAAGGSSNQCRVETVDSCRKLVKDSR